MHFSPQAIAGVASLLLCGPALSAGTGHCNAKEEVVFNCELRGGKTVSVCSSTNLSSNSGYLHYRFGPPGQVELQFPSGTRNTQEQFTFESHRPYATESEFLNFKRGAYEYTVYRVLTDDPESKNSAGVQVSKGERVVSDLKCLNPIVQQPIGLEAVVPEAK
jgi:hypothetical protein